MTEQELLYIIGEADECYIDELVTFCINRSGRKRRPKGILLAAVIGITLLALTAGAVSLGVVSDVSWFERFFSLGASVHQDAITDNQMELLDRGLVNVGQEVVQDGYAVTLVSALCDGHRLLVKIVVRAPEGVVLEQGRYDLILDYRALYPDGSKIPFGAMTGGCSQLEDSNPADGTLQFLLDVRMQPKQGVDEQMLLGAKWEISISELLFAYDREEEYWLNPLATGEWTFSILFDEASLLTRELEVIDNPIRMRTLRHWGDRVDQTLPVKIRITSLKLRALSVTLCYDKPLTGFWRGIDMEDICIVMKDGTMILAQWDMGHNKGSYWKDTFTLPVPVALEDVAYIQLPDGEQILIDE